MRPWRTSLLALLGAAACATPARDPFAAAENALRHHDLVGALLAYDAVPVCHARYPEARTAAASVEGRMRRCHEMLLEALILRGEWRDADALGFLRLARAVWPALPAVDGLIAATENRIRLFEPRSDGEVTPEPLARPMAPMPAGEVEPAALPAMPLVLLAAPDPVLATDMSPPGHVASPETADSTTSGSPEPASGTAATTDAVARGLAQVESCLARGDLEKAVTDLFELARRFPKDARVQVRLLRLLHQRALLLYGQGALSGAIADWQRMLEIDPSHRLAGKMLEVARSEASPATPRRPVPPRGRHGLPR